MTLFTLGVIVFMAGFLIGKATQPAGDYICIVGAIIVILSLFIKATI